MAYALPIDSELRFDLFLNFHGSEELPYGITTRDFMRLVVRELQRRCSARGATPGIFFDEHCTRGRLSDDIFTAILQLRGGGLGVCILTPRFFDYPWCLAELEALLRVYNPRRYGVRLRFLCLGCEPKDIIHHEHIKLYVDKMRGHSLHGCPIMWPPDKSASNIADVVMNLWDAKDGLADRAPCILGRTRLESMTYLERHFTGSGAKGENVPFVMKEQAISAYHLKWIAAKTFPWGYEQIEALTAMFHHIRIELWEFYRAQREGEEGGEGEEGEEGEEGFFKDGEKYEYTNAQRRPINNNNYPLQHRRAIEGDYSAHRRAIDEMNYQGATEGSPHPPPHPTLPQLQPRKEHDC